MTKYLWENAQKKIKNNNVFLVFTTLWCGDCKMMKPIFNEIEKELKELLDKKNQVEFIEIDAEESKLFRDENSLIKVLKIPAMYIVKNSKMKLIGYEYLSKKIIIKEILKFIN